MCISICWWWYTLILLCYVQVSKQQDNVEPSNQLIMKAILNLENLLSDKLSEVYYRLDRVDDALVDVKDDLTLIRGDLNSMEVEVSALGLRSSLTLTASQKGKILQEQTVSLLNDMKMNLSEEIQAVTNTVLTLEQNFSNMKQDTESFKDPINTIKNGVLSLDSLKDPVKKNQEIIQDVKHNTEDLKNYMYQLMQKTAEHCPVDMVYGDHDIVCPDKNQKTWQQAFDYCRSLGLDLAQPKHLLSLAAKLVETQDCNCWYWLGGKGSGSEQVWLNTTSLSSSLSVWSSGYPKTTTTDCLVLKSSNTTTQVLQTSVCSATNGHTVCAAGYCPDEMIHADDDIVCPKIKAHKTWEQAYYYCKRLGLILAQPQHLLSLSTKLVETLGDDYWFWLGGRGWGSHQLWLNGSVVDPSLSLWMSGNPKTTVTECLVLQTSSTSTQVLKTRACSTTSGYALCTDH